MQSIKNYNPNQVLEYFGNVFTVCQTNNPLLVAKASYESLSSNVDLWQRGNLKIIAHQFYNYISFFAFETPQKLILVLVLRFNPIPTGCSVLAKIKIREDLPAGDVAALNKWFLDQYIPIITNLLQDITKAVNQGNFKLKRPIYGPISLKEFTAIPGKYRKKPEKAYSIIFGLINRMKDKYPQTPLEHALNQGLGPDYPALISILKIPEGSAFYIKGTSPDGKIYSSELMDKMSLAEIADSGIICEVESDGSDMGLGPQSTISSSTPTNRPKITTSPIMTTPTPNTNISTSSYQYSSGPIKGQGLFGNIASSPSANPMKKTTPVTTPATTTAPSSNANANLNVCQVCGTVNAFTMKFCRKCGEKIERKKA